MAAKIETGKLDGLYSYVRFGNGNEKLIIFPPLHDALYEAASFARYLHSLFKPLGRRFTVYIVSRKRNLPVGYTTRDMAADYAAVFKKYFGPSYVVGVSLGGLIAQYLAIDYPQYVKKLIVVGAAHCMGHDGLSIAKRWIPWARNGLWEEIYDESVEITYTGSYRWIYALLKPIIRRWMHRKMSKDPSDFIICGQAGMIHDTFDQLESISMPTMIIAGNRDHFFPETLFHGMIRKIPNCQKIFIHNAGHGVFEEHKKKCVNFILDFIIEEKIEHLSAESWNPSILNTAGS